MSNKTVTEFLKGFSLFTSLNHEELDQIARISSTKTIEKTSQIILQGERLKQVYFIQSELIKIRKTDIHGREHIVNILKAGEMFPHVGFFRQSDYPATAETMEKSILTSIPIEGFERILISNPALSMKVLKVLGEKIVDLQEKLEAQMSNTTQEQIIKLPLRLASDHGAKLKDGKVKLTFSYTNKDLANMIGSTRETVNRALVNYST